MQEAPETFGVHLTSCTSPHTTCSFDLGFWGLAFRATAKPIKINLFAARNVRQHSHCYRTSSSRQRCR
jgi:hypothetical protein